MTEITPHQHEFLERIEKNLEGLTHIGIGNASPICEVCREFEEGDTIEFSRHNCDSCGSPLAGQRVIAHGLFEDTNEVIHLEICLDCAMYHANGELPEEEE